MVGVYNDFQLQDTNEDDAKLLKVISLHFIILFNSFEA